MTTKQIPRPSAVSAAVTLLYLSLFAGILNSITTDSRAIMRHSATGSGFVITMYVVFILMVFHVHMISTGRNWARVLFLVLSLLGAVFVVPYLLPTLNTSEPDMLFIGQTAAQVAAMILLFLPESCDWFNMMKAARIAEFMGMAGQPVAAQSTPSSPRVTIRRKRTPQIVPCGHCGDMIDVAGVSGRFACPRCGGPLSI